MTICKISAKPMYFKGKLDTELRLGTSNLETIPIPKLGGADPLAITLSSPSTISKLDNTDALKLTLAPSSEFTPKKASSASRTPKKTRFKYKTQPKQSLTITPDGKLWLDDYIIPKPMSHLQGNHASVIPYESLMIGAIPSSLPTHYVEGAAPINLHIREASTHSLSRYHGSESTSFQGFPTPARPPENFPNRIEESRHSIIEPVSFEIRPVQSSRVTEEPKVSGTYSNVDEKSPTTQARHDDVIEPDGYKPYTVTHVSMPELTKFGQTQLRARVEFRLEIAIWFGDLEEILVERSKAEKITGLARGDIRRALDRAQNKLTPTFCGFLIRSYHHPRGRSDIELLREGWEYLKKYMEKWKYVNLAVVAKLHDLKVDSSVSQWTPDEVLAYLMWFYGRNALSTKFLSKFTNGWPNLNVI